MSILWETGASEVTIPSQGEGLQPLRQDRAYGLYMSCQRKCSDANWQHTYSASKARCHVRRSGTKSGGRHMVLPRLRFQKFRLQAAEMPVLPHKAHGAREKHIIYFKISAQIYQRKGRRGGIRSRREDGGGVSGASFLAGASRRCCQGKKN